MGAVAAKLCPASVWEEPETPLKKSELRARWPILVILCLGLFGSYYTYDIPAATETALAQQWNETSASSSGNSTDGGGVGSSFNFKFNLLYSLYSYPNTVLPFLSGIITDVLGVRLMGVIFMAFMVVGQVITSFGATMENESSAWITMWIGRATFGLGGESLSVVQSAFVAQYFQGKELAFALGVNVALGRVGSVINDVVSALISSNAPVYWAYWVGSIICGISLLAMIFAFYLDLAAEVRLRKNRGLRPLENQGLVFRLLCWWRPAASAAQPSGGDREGLLLPDGSSGEEKVYGDEPPKEEMRLTAVLHFPLVFWLLTLSCVTVYICILTFNNNCGSFVTQKWLTNKPLGQLTTDELNSLTLQANSILLTTYLTSGLLTPFLGGLIDNIGFRAGFCFIAAATAAGLHAVLGLTNIYPVAPLVGLGISYSFYAAALWPSIAVVIPPENQATAYGVVTAVQNLGLAVSPSVVAYFMPDTNCPTYDECVRGWNNTELFFVGCGAAGVLCGALLNVADHARKGGSILNVGRVGCCARKDVAQLRGESLVDEDGYPLPGGQREAL